jgi:hypothetical protein
MSNRFLISAAAIALIASAGFANAQGTGMGREQGGAAAQQSAPPTGNSAAPSNRNAMEPSGSSSGMKSTQSDEKSPAGAAKGKSAEETAPGQKSKGMSSENETKGAKDMKAEGRKDQKSTESERNKSSTVGQSQRSEENAPGQKQKGMSTETETKGNKEMKAQGNEGRTGNMTAPGAEGRNQAQGERSQTTTTGQAGAAAKLSTEQRTKITTVIRNERVEPLNSVKFSIAVGTRVPREGVSFRPLPAEVVTIYPEWRGYEFIRVRDQILVIDPATYEIVAILDV